MADQLTSRKKWQLAVQLLLMYSPLLLYVNLPEKARNADSLLVVSPYFLAFSVVALLLYYVWITATDWIQDCLFKRFGTHFMLEFDWLALALTMLISLGLAILYILAIQYILQTVFVVVFETWPSFRPQNPGSNLPIEVINYVRRANNGFSVVIVISAFYLTTIARSYEQLKNVKLRAERLEKEFAVSQLEALKNQLSPHFLFNSLSILRSLVHEDADLSEEFIGQLSKVYRYILEQRDQELVALNTELDFILAYAFLLQIRFENKFEVVIEIPEETRTQYRIAPLSLQMLVENVVKHNRMSTRELLRVRIGVKDEYLVVENPVQRREQPENSTGVGLKNIISRYGLLTDREVRCEEVNGFFIVQIPLLS